MGATVVRGLAEKELTQFADLLQTRILQSAPMTEEEQTKWAAKQKQKYKTFVETNSSFFEGFLQVSGGLSVSVLARETTKSRC